MDKEWEMIFELEWGYGHVNKVPKVYGHQLDGMSDTEEKKQYMGVTPRGMNTTTGSQH